MDAADLTALAEDVRARYGLPGLLLGFADPTGRHVVASGVGDVRTSQALQPSTPVQIGSITKPMTATLLLTFVEEGRLGLEDPVAAHLPGFALADPDIAETITVGHVLDHSCGWDSADLVPDLGVGNDARDAYLGLLAQVGQIHPAGMFPSYNNGGYVVAGMLAEELGKHDYTSLLADRVLAPAGMHQTTLGAQPEGAGIGSFPDGKGGWMPTPMIDLPSTGRPAGSQTWSTADDVLDFLLAHTSRGDAFPASVTEAMRTATHALPGGANENMGLSWLVDESASGVRLSHPGAVVGAFAHCGVLPDQGIAWFGWANSPAALLALGAVEDALTPATNNVLASTSQGTATTDTEAMLGTYRRLGRRLTVDAMPGDGLSVVTHLDQALPEGLGFLAPPPMKAQSVSQGLAQVPDLARSILRQRLSFCGDDGTGRYRYLWHGLQIHERCDP